MTEKDGVFSTTDLQEEVQAKFMVLEKLDAESWTFKDIKEEIARIGAKISERQRLRAEVEKVIDECEDKGKTLGFRPRWISVEELKKRLFGEE